MQVNKLKAVSNVRHDDAPDAQLIESIKKWGVLHPLLITKDGVVIDGHRRLNAAKAAGLKDVPVVITDLQTDEVGAVQVTSNQGKHLTAGEVYTVVAKQFTADEVKGLTEQIVDRAKYGPKLRAVAVSFGLSPKSVLAALRLANLPAKIKKQLDSGVISEYGAIKLSGLPTDKLDRFLDTMTVGINLELGRIEDGTIVRWIDANAERKLEHAVFDTAGCMGCVYNDGMSDLFGGKNSLGTCANFDCWNAKKALHFSQKKEALLKKVNTKLPVVGQVSPDYEGKFKYKGRPVHSKLEGELAKLAKESEGKKEKDASVGAVIIKDDNGPRAIGYVVLKQEVVKSTKLKVPEQDTRDWEKERFIKDYIDLVLAGLFIQKKWSEATLAEMFAKLVGMEKQTNLAEAIRFYLSREMTGHDMTKALGVSYEKIAKEQTPIAEKEYLAKKQEKANV